VSINKATGTWWLTSEANRADATRWLASAIGSSAVMAAGAKGVDPKGGPTSD